MPLTGEVKPAKGTYWPILDGDDNPIPEQHFIDIARDVSQQSRWLTARRNRYAQELHALHEYFDRVSYVFGDPVQMRRDQRLQNVKRRHDLATVEIERNKHFLKRVSDQVPEPVRDKMRAVWVAEYRNPSPPTCPDRYLHIHERDFQP